MIPARLESSRLPRKPLVRLAGRTLIEWVWLRATESARFAEVVVATDSEEVAAEVRRFGGRVELTSSAHPSGTDRVAEVVVRPGYRHHSSVVNVQGDEPFIAAAHIDPAIELVEAGGWEIGTVATPILDPDELLDPSAVKVVRDDAGGALYFSRAPIPHRRESASPTEADSAPLHLRHLGVYAYQPEALARWVALPAGRLEEVERLEQLRPLAAGIRIGVEIVEPLERGVDTPADRLRADERLLAELNRLT